MLVVLPPGEMQSLACDDCKGNTFYLKQEVKDGEIEIFHTVCVGCGKRGCLHAEVKVTTYRKFIQFADPPKELKGWEIHET